MEDPYSGMSMNERLLASGLVEAFDRAFRARDRAALIDIYRRVGGAAFAESAVDAMLSDPDRYDPDKARAAEWARLNSPDYRGPDPRRWPLADDDGGD